MYLRNKGIFTKLIRKNSLLTKYVYFQKPNMDNDQELVKEDYAVKKVVKLNQKVPKFEHLNKLTQKYDKLENIEKGYENYSNDYEKVVRNLDRVGQKLDNLNLEKVGYLVGQVENGLRLDRITVESERLSHSEKSSRRNSDDGGRAKNEGFRNGM